MNHSLIKKEAEVYQEIEQPILLTFKTITASRYVTNRHLEQFSTDAITQISGLKTDYPWLYLLTYMGGVFERSTHLTNYQEFERRFTYFYHTLSDEIISQVKHIDARSYRLFVNRLLKRIAKHSRILQAPWSHLLLKLLPTMPAAHIDHVYQTLSSSIDPSECSQSVALAYSYVALLAGKEMSSIGILQKNGVNYREQEVTPHFQLLKERARWQTMKQWFIVLFPQKKTGQYGSLQKFMDEMNTVLPISSKEQESIWNRWLLSPNYQRFKTYTRHLSDTQQLKLVERILPELEQRLHQIEAAKTYEKILLVYEQYELAARYFLKYERDPTRLREEKLELLAALKVARPDLSRPIYHQFIVRLVEKKSRIHYEQAASYLSELQSLYTSDKEQIMFMTYVKRLKKMYRTYRAFVEELKRIDL
ncbi:hypothetical protein [Halalkalibacter alkalisediminis]|uniref:Uncharacterized protein n=1 Tax=Halalkalibacter alkalisediminis TaxID=935616 RepID=A0ABV6NAC5_9BACI|nr:hypothetical protein [Halalkalibacter alkalisediminis]